MSDRQFEDLLRETLEEYGEPGETPRDAMWRAVSDSRRKVVRLPWWRRPVSRVDFLAGAVAAAVLVMVGVLVGRMGSNPPNPTDRQPSQVAQGPTHEAPAPTTNPVESTGGSAPVTERQLADDDRIAADDRMAGAPRTPRVGRTGTADRGSTDERVSTGGGVPVGQGGELDLGMRTRADDGNREVLRLAANQYLSRTESFLTRWRAGDPAAASGEWTREWARRGLTDVRLLLDTAGNDDPEMKALLLDMEVILAQILQASADTSSLDRDRAERRLNDRAVLPRLRSMIPAGKEAAAIQGVPR